MDPLLAVPVTDVEVVDEIDLGTITASQAAYGRRAVLYGWSAMETTGAAAAKLRIRDGASVGGSVLARVAIAQGASDQAFTADHGVRAEGGLYVEVVSGSVELTLYVKAITDLD